MGVRVRVRVGVRARIRVSLPTPAWPDVSVRRLPGVRAHRTSKTFLLLNRRDELRVVCEPLNGQSVGVVIRVGPAVAGPYRQ